MLSLKNLLPYIQVNCTLLSTSLRGRRLEVAGERENGRSRGRRERENGRSRGRHARGEGASSPLACLLLARPFFLVPTTSKLRRLTIDKQLCRVWSVYRRRQFLLPEKKNNNNKNIKTKCAFLQISLVLFLC